MGTGTEEGPVQERRSGGDGDSTDFLPSMHFSRDLPGALTQGKETPSGSKVLLHLKCLSQLTCNDRRHQVIWGIKERGQGLNPTQSLLSTCYHSFERESTLNAS